MITLYIKQNCPHCKIIQDKLDELVLNYKIINVDEAAVQENVPVDSDLVPLIQDGDRQIEGKNDLDAYLVEVEKMVEAWRKFQSDSCYIDDDGKVC